MSKTYKIRDFGSCTEALSLNTATLGHNIDGHGVGWSVERVIDACAERGFGGIVFWQREVEKNAIQIGNRARSSGLRVDGLCRTPFLVGSLSPENWCDQAKMSIDLAASLGAPVVTIVSGGTVPGTLGVIESQKILAERIAVLSDFALERRIQLALEPLNPMFGGNRTCLFSVEDALRVCDAVGAPNLGIAVDVYHLWWDSALEESCSKASGRIVGYHLCDWLENTSDLLLDRGMMGDGVADLKGIRRAVEASGYSGPCEVEVFSARDWWCRDPNEVLDQVIHRFKTVC